MTRSAPGKKSVFTEPVVAIVLSTLLTILLRILLDKIQPYQPYLSGLWNLWWFRTVATIFVSLIGGSLFLVKKRFQMFYGFSEICFAAVVIWTGIGRVETAKDAASWIALIGGAYLIVRGSSNIDEARKKRLKTL